MCKSSARLGFWSALTGISAFVVYILSFVIILFINPAFTWTDFNAFLAYTAKYDQFFKYLAMFFMLVYGICFVIQLVCIDEFIDKSKHFYAKLAMLFGLGFAVLIGINYFIQLSAVRLQLESGQTEGLEQFIMSFPISGIASINMLGWTLFFGLASLFRACLTTARFHYMARNLSSQTRIFA